MKKFAFNPYLPSYEYIPDGEPRVFGERLYVFGSHDKFGGNDFCLNDYVAWSAPIDDLSDWRFEGVIYRKEQDPRSGEKLPLFAPDVIRGSDGRYYLYYSVKDSSVISVADSNAPAGKYEYYDDVKTPEGRVCGTLPDDYYEFIEERFQLRGSRQSFRLGERLLVQVAGVDWGMRRTQFRLLTKLDKA